LKWAGARAAAARAAVTHHFLTSCAQQNQQERFKNETINSLNVFVYY
jgi:hypothetical protein